MVEMNSKVMLDKSSPSTDCALVPYIKRTSTRTNNKTLLNIELPLDLELETIQYCRRNVLTVTLFTTTFYFGAILVHISNNLNYKN